MSVVSTALKNAMEPQGKAIDAILNQPEDGRIIQTADAVSPELIKRFVTELSAQSLALVPCRPPQLVTLRRRGLSQKTRYALLCLAATTVLTIVSTTVAVEWIEMKRDVRAAAGDAPAVRSVSQVQAQPEQSALHQPQPLPIAPIEDAKLERTHDVAAQPPGTNEMASIPGVVQHRNPTGDVDYWLAPLWTAGSRRMIEVRPYGLSRYGVRVHNDEDGQNYVLAGNGNWLPGSALHRR